MKVLTHHLHDVHYIMLSKLRVTRIIKQGSESQSKFDGSSYSSNTTLINYLIHLVETILRLRDNVDPNVEQPKFSGERDENTSRCSYTCNKTNYEHDTAKVYGTKVISDSYKELTSKSRNTFDIVQLDNKRNKTSVFKKDVSSQNVDTLFYDLALSTKDKNVLEFRNSFDLEGMNEKKSESKKGQEKSNKNNSFPLDLMESGSTVGQLSIQPWKTLTDKDRRGNRKGRQHNLRGKSNHNKMTSNRNMSFSDLLSPRVGSSSTSRSEILHPIRKTHNSRSTKRSHLAKLNLFNNVGLRKSKSQLLADKAKAIRNEAMLFHEELQKKFEKYEKRKTQKLKESLPIPLRIRNLLEKVRVSLIAEKIRYLQNQKQQQSGIYTDNQQPIKHKKSRYDILADKIAKLKKQNEVIDILDKLQATNSAQSIDVIPNDKKLYQDTHNYKQTDLLKETSKKVPKKQNEFYHSAVETNITSYSKTGFKGTQSQMESNSDLKSYNDADSDRKETFVETGFGAIRDKGNLSRLWESAKLGHHNKKMRNENDLSNSTILMDNHSAELIRSTIINGSKTSDAKVHNKSPNINVYKSTQQQHIELTEQQTTVAEKNDVFGNDDVDTYARKTFLNFCASPHCKNISDVGMNDFKYPPYKDSESYVPPSLGFGTNTKNDQYTDNNSLNMPRIISGVNNYEELYIDEYDTNLGDVLTDDYIVYDSSIHDEPSIDLEGIKSLDSVKNNVPKSIVNDKNKTLFVIGDETQSTNIFKDRHKTRDKDIITQQKAFEEANKPKSQHVHTKATNSIDYLSDGLSKSITHTYSNVAPVNVSYVIRSNTSNILKGGNKGEDALFLAPTSSSHSNNDGNGFIETNGNINNTKNGLLGVKSYDVMNFKSNDSLNIQVSPLRILEVNLKIPFDVLYKGTDILPTTSNTILFDAKYQADGENISSHENNVTRIDKPAMNRNSTSSMLTTEELNIGSNRTKNPDISMVSTKIHNGLISHEWKQKYGTTRSPNVLKMHSTKNNLRSEFDTSIYSSLSNKYNLEKNKLSSDDVSSLPLPYSRGQYNPMSYYLNRDIYDQTTRKQDSLSFVGRQYPAKAYSEFSKYDRQSPSYGIYVTPMPYSSDLQKNNKELNAISNLEKNLEELSSVLEVKQNMQGLDTIFDLENSLDLAEHNREQFVSSNTHNYPVQPDATMHIHSTRKNTKNTTPTLRSSTAYNRNVGVNKKDTIQTIHRLSKPYVLVAKKSTRIENLEDISASETNLSHIFNLPEDKMASSEAIKKFEVVSNNKFRSRKGENAMGNNAKYISTSNSYNNVARKLDKNETLNTNNDDKYRKLLVTISFDQKDNKDRSVNDTERHSLPFNYKANVHKESAYKNKANTEREIATTITSKVAKDILDVDIAKFIPIVTQQVAVEKIDNLVHNSTNVTTPKTHIFTRETNSHNVDLQLSSTLVNNSSDIQIEPSYATVDINDISNNENSKKGEDQYLKKIDGKSHLANTGLHEKYNKKVFLSPLHNYSDIPIRGYQGWIPLIPNRKAKVNDSSINRNSGNFLSISKFEKSQKRQNKKSNQNSSFSSSFLSPMKTFGDSPSKSYHQMTKQKQFGGSIWNAFQFLDNLEDNPLKRG